MTSEQVIDANALNSVVRRFEEQEELDCRALLRLCHAFVDLLNARHFDGLLAPCFLVLEDNDIRRPGG
jgi:regulator of sigma D